MIRSYLKILFVVILIPTKSREESHHRIPRKKNRYFVAGSIPLKAGLLEMTYAPFSDGF